MKRILLISNYQRNVGGISVQVDILQRCLQQEGYVADIFSTKGNVIKRILTFFRLLCTIPHYDVLHIHACSDWGMLPVVYGVICGKVWHKRIVVTYHGGGINLYLAAHGDFARRWLSYADHVIVLSGYLESRFIKYHIPCVVIPNIAEFTRRVKKDGEIKPKFISIRHLTELYNIECILRAFERVQKEFPAASLDILGQGNHRSSLEQYVQDHHLQHVRFLGQVSKDEVFEYLLENDIMLSAPRIDNMPVSILEAMNIGLLVISSRVGGIPYLIEDDKTGLLFESDNDAELAEKMSWVISHVEDSLRIIKEAQLEVKKYEWGKVKNLLLPLYQ